MQEPHPEKTQSLEKEMDFYEAITCVFNFKEHELLVYFKLAENPMSTVDALADQMQRDRSWVHRALTTLLNLGLARRHYRILSHGGYVYQYEAIPMEEARAKLRGALEKWYQGTLEMVEGCLQAGKPC